MQVFKKPESISWKYNTQSLIIERLPPLLLREEWLDRKSLLFQMSKIPLKTRFAPGYPVVKGLGRETPNCPILWFPFISESRNWAT